MRLGRRSVGLFFFLGLSVVPSTKADADTNQLIAGCSQGACAVGWCEVPEDGICIQVMASSGPSTGASSGAPYAKSYADATQKCQSLGGPNNVGNLASIHSRAADELISQMAAQNADGVWIGLSDQVLPNTWTFADASGKPTSFKPWAAGEPVSGQCTVLEPLAQTWNTRDCHSLRGYVCEYTAYTAVSTNSPTTTTTTTTPTTTTTTTTTRTTTTTPTTTATTTTTTTTKTIITTISATTTTATMIHVTNMTARVFGYAMPTNVVTGEFPGPTAVLSNSAFSAGGEPTSLQYWPKVSATSSQLALCQDHTVVPSVDDYPFTCGLVATVAATETDCATECVDSPYCAVWQWNFTTSGCSMGTGTLCAPGQAVLVTHGVKHGAVRVLTNVTSVKINKLRSLGLISVTSPPGSPSSVAQMKAAMMCKQWCYYNIKCRYWQFNISNGCFVEDPDSYSVPVPLVLGAGATADIPDQILFGEYIQHYCPPQETTPAPAPVVVAEGPSYGLIMGALLGAVAGLAVVAYLCRYCKSSNVPRKSRAVKTPKTRALAPVEERVPLKEETSPLLEAPSWLHPNRLQPAPFQPAFQQAPFQAQFAPVAPYPMAGVGSIIGAPPYAPTGVGSIIGAPPPTMTYASSVGSIIGAPPSTMTYAPTGVGSMIGAPPPTVTYAGAPATFATATYSTAPPTVPTYITNPMSPGMAPRAAPTFGSGAAGSIVGAAPGMAPRAAPTFGSGAAGSIVGAAPGRIAR